MEKIHPREKVFSKICFYGPKWTKKWLDSNFHNFLLDFPWGMSNMPSLIKIHFLPLKSVWERDGPVKVQSEYLPTDVDEIIETLSGFTAK